MLFRSVFAVVRAGRGVEARDALWQHPDLLPGPDALADPLGFIETSTSELEFVVPDDLSGLDGLDDGDGNGADGAS